MKTNKQTFDICSCSLGHQPKAVSHLLSGVKGHTHLRGAPLDKLRIIMLAVQVTAYVIKT